VGLIFLQEKVLNFSKDLLSPEMSVVFTYFAILLMRGLFEMGSRSAAHAAPTLICHYFTVSAILSQYWFGLLGTISSDWL